MFTIDRLDYVSGAWLFWSEHHSGQGSEGYARLSRYQFNPGACFTGWQSLSECARDVYRAWCARENVDCTYDQLAYLIADDFDADDACVEYFVDRYNDDPEALSNYGTSDFVNIDMCYTRDLLNFYDQNEAEIKQWFEAMCDAYGYTSTLEALQGDTIDDPDDMKSAMVNHAMTYLARQILSTIKGDF